MKSEERTGEEWRGDERRGEEERKRVLAVAINPGDSGPGAASRLR